MDSLNDQTISRHLEDYSKEQHRIMGEVKGNGEAKGLARELQIVGSIIGGLIKLRELRRKKSE